MNDVSEIREELAQIVFSLRSERHDAEASRLEALNSAFFTTTTEYLVEFLDMIDDLTAAGTLQRLSVPIRKRIESLRIKARRLAHLR